jgi:ATP-dependent Clp protease ATP-binding subunit ClpA
LTKTAELSELQKNPVSQREVGKRYCRRYSRWTGIPIEKMISEDTDKLKNMKPNCTNK